MFQHQTLRGRVISQVLVVICLLILVLPLGMILLTSLQGEGATNYVAVLTTTPFALFLWNSVVVSVCTVAIVLVSAILAAYGIVILRPRGARAAMVVILAGMSLPAIALIVPLYSVVQRLGLLNTYWAVVIPLAAISIPFGALVGANYIRGLPIELYEAARLDGAGDFRFFWSILLPICRPILAVIAIFTFLAAWNEYLLPLIFIQDTDLQVLTQVPTYFQSQRLVDTPKVFAANVLISLPIVLAYLLMQGMFRRGMSAGALK
jgi:raffinose/stachyose/melibiose transport system permease protein